MHLDEEQMSVFNQFKQYFDDPELSNAGTIIAISSMDRAKTWA